MENNEKINSARRFLSAQITKISDQLKANEEKKDPQLKIPPDIVRTLINQRAELQKARENLILETRRASLENLMTQSGKMLEEIKEGVLKSQIKELKKETFSFKEILYLPVKKKRKK